MQQKQWSELKTWQKGMLIEIAFIQIGLFVAAWLDLNQRLAENINGSKKAWRAALFLNFLGPLTYFRKARKQREWSEADVPDMNGKVAIVTGANSGIGYDTTRVLAQRGATVIMACRNLDKAKLAADKLRALNPKGTVDVMQLDLADLDSVRQFAGAFNAKYDRLDLLINNAGIMVPPLGRTKQGFETQWGVNHLGHFALTALLNDQLSNTPRSRVVTVSSNAHRFGHIDFSDLNWQDREYDAMQAYAQSKLANLLFTHKLQQEFEAADQETLAVAAHPGYTATKLQGDSVFMTLANRLFAQPQPMGALPTLYAATADDVEGGQYFGPSSFGELRGNPERVKSNARSHNMETAQRLWTVSETLTDTQFQL